MREIRLLEAQRQDIVIALDEACYQFQKNAQEAIRNGMHVNVDFTVSGVAQLLAQNTQLIEDVCRYGERTKSLTDKLTHVDSRLDELYRSKFEEIIGMYSQNPLFAADIEFYRQNFQVALNDRNAANFLENMLIRL